MQIVVVCGVGSAVRGCAALVYRYLKLAMEVWMQGFYFAPVPCIVLYMHQRWKCMHENLEVACVGMRSCV
jgi:hypothetical protein